MYMCRYTSHGAVPQIIKEISSSDGAVPNRKQIINKQIFPKKCKQILNKIPQILKKMSANCKQISTETLALIILGRFFCFISEIGSLRAAMMSVEQYETVNSFIITQYSVVDIGGAHTTAPTDPTGPTCSSFFSIIFVSLRYRDKIFLNSRNFTLLLTKPAVSHKNNFMGVAVIVNTSVDIPDKIRGIFTHTCYFTCIFTATLYT